MVIIREMNKYDAIDRWLESLEVCRKDTTRGGSYFSQIITEQLVTTQEEIRARCIKFGLWHLQKFGNLTPKTVNWHAKLTRLANTGVIPEHLGIQLICQAYGVDVTIFDATTYKCKKFPINATCETSPVLMLCKMGKNQFAVVVPVLMEEIKQKKIELEQLLDDDDYKEQQKLLKAQKVASEVVIPYSKRPPLSMKDETTSIEEPSPLVLQTNDLNHTQEQSDASLLQIALFPQMSEVAAERYFTEAANYRQEIIEVARHQHFNHAVFEESSTTQNVYVTHHTTDISQQQRFVIYYRYLSVIITITIGVMYYIHVANMNRTMYPMSVPNQTFQPPTTVTIRVQVPHLDFVIYRYIFENRNAAFVMRPVSNTDSARSST